MIKQKGFLITVIAATVILAILIGIAVGMVVNEYKEISYPLEDTLADGGGRSARVIILAGQSNASGCSRDDYLVRNVSPEKYAEYEAGYDNVYINYFASGTNQSNGFVKASVRQGEGGGFFGPELGVADKLHDLYPDEHFFIIKYAWGGTNLYEQWLSPSSSGRVGTLYKHFMKYVKRSMDYLIAKNYDVKIEGVLWMQGESDSFSVENGTEYKTHLANFIKDVRSELSRYADDDGIAFVDAYIADNPVFWVYCDLVNASKDEVAAMSPMNVIVDTISAGLDCTKEPEDTPDVPHYDSLSEIKLGHLFAEAVAGFFD